MSYDGAKKNTDGLFYISPREDVRLEQVQEAKSADIKELFQVKFRPNDDIFRFDPVSKELIDNVWNRLGVNR